MNIIEAFVHSGLCKSKGEARRLIRQGGAYINGKRVENENRALIITDYMGNVLTLRKGKKTFADLKLTEEPKQKVKPFQKYSEPEFTKWKGGMLK